MLPEVPLVPDIHPSRPSRGLHPISAARAVPAQPERHPSMCISQPPNSYSSSLDSEVRSSGPCDQAPGLPSSWCGWDLQTDSSQAQYRVAEFARYRRYHAHGTLQTFLGSRVMPLK